MLCQCTAAVAESSYTAVDHLLLQGLLRIATLLTVPEYRGAVLEGLVASIGGLDASLCKEASAALVATLHTVDQQTNQPAGAVNSLQT